MPRERNPQISFDDPNAGHWSYVDGGPEVEKSIRLDSTLGSTAVNVKQRFFFPPKEPLPSFCFLMFCELTHCPKSKYDLLVETL